MKRAFLYILTAVLAVGCKNSSVQQSKENDDKPVITVTIEPLRYFTEAIAGDHFSIVSMVPKGSSPGPTTPLPNNSWSWPRARLISALGTSASSRSGWTS